MADLLIAGRLVLDDGTEPADGWLTVDGARITEVGAGDPGDRRRREAGRVLAPPGALVAPGFVNSHTHLFQTFLRGLRDDLDHSEWIGRVIGDNAGRLTEEDVHLAALLGSVENLLAGVTTVVENHYLHTSPKNSDEVLRAMATSGIRGWFARGTLDIGDSIRAVAGPGAAATNVETPDQSLGELERLAGEWHGAAGGRISVGVAVQSAWAASTGLLERLAAFAHDHDLLLHAHCAETADSDRRCRALHGRSEAATFAATGFLGPRTQMVHGVWLDPEDLEIVADRGATVVHCPVANAYLASGTAPVAEMLAAGIPVALGADGSASNHRQDPFESMKAAVLLQRARTMDATSLSPEDALRMARSEAAATLGRPGEIGVLRAGALADIALLDTRRAHLQPVHRMASTLVMCAMPADVTHVVVNGTLVVEDGVVTTLDQAELIERCAHRAADLGFAVGTSPLGGSRT
ncbi:MAG: amidohydrolase [Actinomycetia bacterium]|nr:amidohydrolase [Actinomycetes bacterium]